jgi:hypothetical protein
VIIGSLTAKAADETNATVVLLDFLVREIEVELPATVSLLFGTTVALYDITHMVDGNLRGS